MPASALPELALLPSMIRVFPYDVAYLPRTKLSYINLPRVLNDGKRDRSARVSGFVVIRLGEICDLIFLNDGEPFNAARIRGGQRSPVSITEVLRRTTLEIERGENGTVGYYGATEAQLRAMLATLLFRPVSLGTELDAALPDRLFSALRERRFSGVMELRGGAAHHFLSFEDGEYRGGYFAGRQEGVSAGEFLGSLFRSGAGELSVELYPPVDQLPLQASPGQLNLFRRVVQRATAELQVHSGNDAGREAAHAARARVAEQHPCVAAFRWARDGWSLSDAVVEPQALTAGVAAWMTELFAPRADAALDPAEILARITRDDRYVLAGLGFFRRLPWPVGF